MCGPPPTIVARPFYGAENSVHIEFSPELLDYIATLALSAPTGNEHLGVGIGHVGYNVNNHLERLMGIFTPDVEFGVGNTSSLIRNRVVKSYTSYGPLTFFQAGSGIDLPDAFNLDAEGYEQLPIGTQTVYSRTTRKHGVVLTQTSGLLEWLNRQETVPNQSVDLQLSPCIY